jgi:hypothetical protein
MSTISNQSYYHKGLGNSLRISYKYWILQSCRYDVIGHVFTLDV